MKPFLSVILIFVHGIFHLPGFIKACTIYPVNYLTLPVSGPMGLAWLLGFLTFGLVAFMYLRNSPIRWKIGLIAVIISQGLIIYFWEDLSYGTIPNALLFAFFVKEGFETNFLNMINSEIEYISSLRPLSARKITENDIMMLPDPVQKWLKNSGIVDKLPIAAIRLSQECLLKLTSNQKNWFPAYAEEYFITKEPAFVWKVSMTILALIQITGRDKLINGRGEMLIKAFSILSLVDATNSIRINQGTLQRYLGEIVWFPSAALSPFITWEAIDDSAARAIIHSGNTVASGIFHFDSSGRFSRFECMRYMDGSSKSRLTKWEIIASEWEKVTDIEIPTRLRAIWQLEKGNWEWAMFHVTAVHYDFCRPVNELRKMHKIL